jgi:hypothetical protein
MSGVNNHPSGENSPNLVTLAESDARYKMIGLLIIYRFLETAFEAKNDQVCTAIHIPIM